MPRPTRRTLLTATPALAAASEVAVAHTAYLPYEPDRCPHEEEFLTVDVGPGYCPEVDDIDYDALDAAQCIWCERREVAVERLADARAKSLGELETKLVVLVQELRHDGIFEEIEGELLLSCLRDLRALQVA